MLLWQCPVIALQLLFVACQEDVGGSLVRIAHRSSVKPTLRLHAVLDVVTSSDSCIIGVDISVVEGKQLTKSLLRADCRDEKQVTVDVELSTQSLWETYRRSWRLQMCAVLLREDDNTLVSASLSHHDDLELQTLNHDELLEMSLSFDCHVIGIVNRRDLFSWSWMAVLRSKIESTCHNGNGISHLLDFPLVMSGGYSGFKRESTVWQPHDDYWAEFSSSEPRFSLSLWLFATHYCDSTLCGILLRPHKELYRSPSLFVQQNGILLVQFVMASGKGQIYSSPWPVPISKWLHITLVAHGLQVQVCISILSVSGARCYDLSFNEPFLYDDSIPWVMGGAVSHQTFHGHIARVTLYRGLQLNKEHFPKFDRVPHWMKVDELQENCSRIRQSIKLLQQFGSTPARMSCSLADWSHSVFNSTLLNNRQSDSLSEEAAHFAHIFLHSHLHLNERDIESLVHANNIPNHLLSSSHRAVVNWLKGKTDGVDPSLALYAGCYNRPDALYLAGSLYLIGQPVTDSKEQGVMLLLAAASQGFPMAQLALGYRHRFGKDGLSGSCPMALSYYLAIAKEAVESLQDGDETKVLTETIRLSKPEMLAGQDGERDDVVQFLMFEAAYGNADAQANLGRMHYWGQQGLRRDFNVAFQYYEQAAGAGLPEAQYNLGIMYLKGQGTQQDNNTALRHMTAAAEQGLTAALNGLGYYYLNSVNSSNVTAAIAYFERAFTLGDHDAAFNLGVVYYNGLTGETPNKTKAAIYWRVAAQQGNPGAAYQLALLAETCDEALKYSIVVAEHHSDVGRVLRKGVAAYLNDSIWEAIVYYMQVAEAGIEVAAFNVAWLSDMLQDVQPTVAANLSYRYFCQSALLNYSVSIIRLGDSYWYGEWGEENKQLAILSYSQAAYLGNGQGLFNLAYVIQQEQWPVKREWIDFNGILLGSRIQSNLTLAAQLYDLCWAQDNSNGQLACCLASLHVRMLMFINEMMSWEWMIFSVASVFWRYLYFVAALSGCIVGLVFRLEAARGVQHDQNM